MSTIVDTWSTSSLPDDFDRWLRKLKDRQGRLRILTRIDRLAHGSGGDVKTVGQGVLELRLT